MFSVALLEVTLDAVRTGLYSKSTRTACQSPQEVQLDPAFFWWLR